MFINKFSSKSRNSLIAHSNVSTNKCYTYCSEKKKCFRSKVPLCLEKVAFCAIHLTSKTYQFNLDLKRISSSSGINVGPTFINFGFFFQFLLPYQKALRFSNLASKIGKIIFFCFFITKRSQIFAKFSMPYVYSFCQFWSLEYLVYSLYPKIF